MIGTCHWIQIRVCPSYHPNTIYLLYPGIKFSCLIEASSQKAISAIFTECPKFSVVASAPCPDGLMINTRIKGTHWGQLLLLVMCTWCGWLWCVCTYYMQAQRRTLGLRLYYTLSCLLETSSHIEPGSKLLASKLQWSSCLCPLHPNPPIYRYCGLCLPGHTQLYLVSYVCMLRICAQVHKFVPPSWAISPSLSCLLNTVYQACSSLCICSFLPVVHGLLHYSLHCCAQIEPPHLITILNSNHFQHTLSPHLDPLCVLWYFTSDTLCIYLLGIDSHPSVSKADWLPDSYWE